MNAMRGILRVLRWLVAAVMVVVLSLNLYAIVQTAIFRNPAPSIFGYRQMVITTGSMEPAIYPGDFIITQEQGEYLAGDIVTYRDGNSFVTHRILSVDGNTVHLKGDNNNTQDEPIQRDRIVGAVVHIIPELGNVALWLRSTPGMVCILAGSFLLLVAPGWIADAVRRKERRSAMAAALPWQDGDDGEGSL